MTGTLSLSNLEDAQKLLASGTLEEREAEIVESLISDITLDLAWQGEAGTLFEPAAWNHKYQKDPVGWAVERLGIPRKTLEWSLNPGYKSHQWDGTREPIMAVCQALADWKDVGIEAGTGTQKTYTAAILVLWFLDCFRNSTVVTIAPKQDQLSLHIWKEIGELWPRFQRIRPNADLDTLRIRMRPRSDKWSAQGFVAGVGATEQVASKAQGFHDEHSLFIFEETPGINPAIMAAFENTCTAPHNLRLAMGNPDSQLDQLHLFSHSPGVVSVRISAEDHPNVVTKNHNLVPGAVSQESIDRRATKYGRDSAIFKSRVRGLSPSQAIDALIQLEWLQKATGRLRDGTVVAGGMTDRDKREKRMQGFAALGVDVAASERGDRGSVAEGEGALLIKVQSYPCPDPNAFAATYVAPRIGPRLSSDRVGIDSVGVGAGAIGEMTRQRKPVVALNGGQGAWVNPEEEELFADLRSQMYWAFRQELFHGEIAIAEEDQELFTDLVTPKWGTSKGKIFVESKEDLVKRLPGRRSPDKGDSAVYWNWVRKDRRPRDPYGPGLRSRTYRGS